jgi:hypothetical protein
VQSLDWHQQWSTQETLKWIINLSLKPAFVLTSVFSKCDNENKEYGLPGLTPLEDYQTFRRFISLPSTGPKNKPSKKPDAACFFWFLAWLSVRWRRYVSPIRRVPRTSRRYSLNIVLIIITTAGTSNPTGLPTLEHRCYSIVLHAYKQEQYCVETKYSICDCTDGPTKNCIQNQKSYMF